MLIFLLCGRSEFLLAPLVHLRRNVLSSLRRLVTTNGEFCSDDSASLECVVIISYAVTHSDKSAVSGSSLKMHKRFHTMTLNIISVKNTPVLRCGLLRCDAVPAGLIEWFWEKLQTSPS